jgi:hypothetical protein
LLTLKLCEFGYADTWKLKKLENKTLREKKFSANPKDPNSPRDLNGTKEESPSHPGGRSTAKRTKEPRCGMVGIILK